MKVKIGKHIDWIGPYQIADWLQYVGISEDRCHKIGKWLADTKLKDICEWIHARRHRKISIQIDGWDTWNADHTMALVISAVMNEYAKQEQVSFGHDLWDVPEFLHPADGKQFKKNHDVDEQYWDRCNWIVNEITWTFNELTGDDPWWPRWETKEQFEDDSYIERVDRMQNGLRLFGKYYAGFWT